MLLLSTILPVLTLAKLVTAKDGDSFRESLTLHPLPDGRLSVLFDFVTEFTSTPSSHSHHSLTPPSLLLPLERNNVSELTVSFVSGQWDQSRSGEAGPLHYESGGGGGEVRGWLKGGEELSRTNEAWTSVTHALGGLFCAGLGPNEEGESVNGFGHIYPPQRPQPDGEELPVPTLGVHSADPSSDAVHYLLPHPFLHLCTENLTPFLALLPSKGLSGLSSLLAQPGIIFSWGFKTEGIEVIMPDALTGQSGQWRGWWEGIVELVPPNPERRGREFSLQSLFKKNIPLPFPEAEESVLRVIMPEESGTGLQVEHEPDTAELKWLDGRLRTVKEWDLVQTGLIGQDLKFWWDEDRFQYPRAFTHPSVSVSRTVVQPHASDGVFAITIRNEGDESREAIYSELWPWWVKGWLHEIQVRDAEQLSRGKLTGSLWNRHGADTAGKAELISDIHYDPSTPPSTSTTTLHLSLTLPPRSELTLTIPFTKLTLKYTEHRPDAERGVEIPSGTLTLLDLLPESDAAEGHTSTKHPRRSGRTRIYTNRLLLDVPTPDFSMPYNVIIMSSTVMAVFFGLMQGTLTRTWSYVQLPKAKS